MQHRHLIEALRPALAGTGTGYLALADALRGLVLDGRLLVGDALPAERALASELATSRTTVTAALTVLRAEGLLASRQGSGTVVTSAPDVVDRPDEAPGSLRSIDIDLTVAAQSAPALLGPLALEAAARLPSQLAGHGLHPLGLRDLRQAVASRLTGRGLPSSAEQILITQGALHGWDLLLRAFTTPGTVVGVEQPTYAGAVDAARAHSLRLVPIGVDAQGWSLPARSAVPVLALVTPDHHNPTGMHADHAQRRDLARGLRDTRLVTDETFSELDLDAGVAQRPLAGYRTGGATEIVTVGSLSKLVWAGLRIGWIRAPHEVIARLGSVRASQDLAAPVLDQLLAVAVFDHLDPIRDERIPVLRSRRDHLLREVAAAGWSARRPAGGLMAWVDLGGALSSTRLAASARAHGVRIAAGPRFSLSGTHDRYLRIPYCAPEPVLTDAIGRLRRAAADPGAPTGTAARWTA